MNNKHSKLKKLLLGTSVLTAALGFGGQAWGAQTPITATATADVTANTYNAITDPAASAVFNVPSKAAAAVTANVFVKSNKDTKSVVVMQQGVAGTHDVTLALELSGANGFSLVNDGANTTTGVTAQLIGLVPGNIGSTQPYDAVAALGNYLGVTATANPTVNMFGGTHALTGDLSAAPVTLNFTSVGNDAAGVPNTTQTVVRADIGMTNLLGLNISSAPIVSGGTAIAAGAGAAHKYTFANAMVTNSGAAMLGGLTVAANTGPVVYYNVGAANRGLNLAYNSFKVDTSAGVMPMADAAQVFALVVNTTTDAPIPANGGLTATNSATLTVASKAGLLSGDNTDPTKASFLLQGTATLTAGTGASVPVVSVKLAPQMYNHIDGTTPANNGVYQVFYNGTDNNYFKRTNGTAATLKVADGTGTTAAAPADTQVQGKLIMGTAGQKVILSGTGILDYNNKANTQAQFIGTDTSKTTEVGPIAFADTGGPVATKTVFISGAGAQKISLSGIPGSITLDNTDKKFANVELVASSAGLIYPGITAAVITDNTTTNLTLSGFSSTLIGTTSAIGRSFVLNAPLVIGNGAAAALTLAGGGNITAPIVMNTNTAITFDGTPTTSATVPNANSVQVYNISSPAYTGDAGTVTTRGTANTSLSNYVTAYDNNQTSTPTTVAALNLASVNLKNAFGTAVASTAGAFNLANNVPTFAVTNKAVLNFAANADKYLGIIDLADANGGTVRFQNGSTFQGAVTNTGGTLPATLIMERGSEFDIYADSVVKSITLTSNDVSGKAIDAKITGSDHVIAFKKVVTATTPTYAVQKLNNAGDLTANFDADTNLVLDVTDANVDGAGALISGATVGVAVLPKVTVSNNAVDATGKPVNAVLGTVSIVSKQTDPKATATAGLRAVSVADGSDYGQSAEKALTAFNVTGDDAMSIYSSGVVSGVTVFAKSVNFTAGAKATAGFSIGDGTNPSKFTFNTSSMSVSSAGNGNVNLLTLATSAGASALTVNPLDNSGVDVHFSVAGGSVAFGDKGVASLGKEAISFAGATFAGGLEFAGAETFTSSAPVTVKGSFAVSKAVDIQGGDFSKSSVKNVSILDSVTFSDTTNNKTAASLLVLTPGKTNPITIGVNSAINVSSATFAGSDLNKLQFAVNPQSEAEAQALTSSAKAALITAGSIGNDVDVATLSVKSLNSNYSRLTAVFSKQDNTQIFRQFMLTMPTMADMKDVVMTEGDSAVMNAMFTAANNGTWTNQDNPLYSLVVGTASNEDLGKAVLSVTPDPKTTAVAMRSSAGIVTSAVSNVSKIVTSRIASLNSAGYASGDFEQPKLGVWAQGFYGKGEQKAFDASSAFERSAAGLVVGADFAMNDSHLMGAAIAYVSSDTKFKGAKEGSRSDNTSYVFNQYSLHDVTESVFLSQNLVIAKTDSKDKKAISGDTSKMLDSAPYDAYYGSFGLSFGRSMNLGNAVILTPSLGGRFQMFGDYKITDTGTNIGAATSVPKTSGFVIAGSVNAAYPVQNDDMTISPELLAGFEYDLNPNKGAFDWSMDSGMVKTGFTGDKNTREAALSTNVGGGVNVKYGMWEVGVKGNLEFKKKYLGWQGALKVRVNF